MPLALNRHGLKSFLALMFCKATYATLTGDDDTLILFLCLFFIEGNQNKVLLKCIIFVMFKPIKQW